MEKSANASKLGFAPEKNGKGPQKALRRSSSSSQQCSEAFAVLFPWILLGWLLGKRCKTNILPNKCWNLSPVFSMKKLCPPEIFWWPFFTTHPILNSSRFTSSSCRRKSRGPHKFNCATRSRPDKIAKQVVQCLGRIYLRIGRVSVQNARIQSWPNESVFSWEFPKP